MKRRLTAFAATVAVLVALGAGVGAAGSDRSISIAPLGTYASGHYLTGGAEIAVFDAGSKRIFVVNLADAAVDILDASNPASPTKVGAIDVTPFGAAANSVAVHEGVVAVAIEASPKTDPGTLAFFKTNGQLLSAVQVGALPDMVTFTPDGKDALVANEGEPNDAYTIDPEGSVSIVHVGKRAAGRPPERRPHGRLRAVRPRGSRPFDPRLRPRGDASPRISSRSTSPCPGTAGPRGSRSRRRTRSASST